MTQLATPSPRVLIPVTQLDDSNRLREDYSHVTALADSIREAGQMLGKAYHLIQPIVITADFKVVDGGSRLRACRDVLKLAEVDVVFMETLAEDQLRVLEMEANIARKDFTWKERVLGVVRVHEYRYRTAVLNPDADRWTQRHTGDLLRQSQASVNYALSLAPYIRNGDKEICEADSLTDALKVLISRKEREATARLAKTTFGNAASGPLSVLDSALSGPRSSVPGPLDSVRPQAGVGAPNDCDAFYTAAEAVLGLGSAVAPDGLGDEMPGQQSAQGAKVQEMQVIPLSRFLLRGDCIELLNSFPPESVDHCLTDIPYGIDMDNLAQAGTGMSDIASVAAEHTVDGNISLMQQMFPAIYRVLKPNSFFVFFYDLDHHEKLQAWAVVAGFKIQRWPLVWHKTHTCINQAAQYNFTKNYEVAMVCRKGNATLVTPDASSVWAGSNEDTKALLGHPFVKPYKLWSWLLSRVALRGQTILDPFAGVGSSTIAAINDGYQPIAMEINEDHYNRQVLNVSNVYRNLLPGCKFS